MLKPPEFDQQRAHRYFAANCFNITWELLDKPRRSAEENDEMLRRALASMYHWTQREDCKPKNLSVGHWQVSRAYALAGEPRLALRHARLSLTLGKNEAPFYVAYSHEGLARAYLADGNKTNAAKHLKAARKLELKIDGDDRKLLATDLKALEKKL